MTSPAFPGVTDSGDGPDIADVPQMIHMIALGRTIAVLPRSLIGPVQSLAGQPLANGANPEAPFDYERYPEMYGPLIAQAQESGTPES